LDGEEEARGLQEGFLHCEEAGEGMEIFFLPADGDGFVAQHGGDSGEVHCEDGVGLVKVQFLHEQA